MRGFCCAPSDLRCESAVFCCELSTISASVTTHHDLLREDELVDFAVLLPRLEDVELDDGFFAVVRDALEVDFLAVAEGLFDAAALDGAFFAAALDVEPEPDEDRSDAELERDCGRPLLVRRDCPRSEP
jgi:hypothetical protein